MDDREHLEELLKFIAGRMDAEAMGLAVVMPGGKGAYATIVAHDPGTAPDPRLFLALSDELYKCALQAASAATHGKQ